MRKFILVAVLFLSGCTDYEVGDYVRVKNQPEPQKLLVVTKKDGQTTTTWWKDRDHRFVNIWPEDELEKWPKDAEKDK